MRSVCLPVYISPGCGLEMHLLVRLLVVACCGVLSCVAFSLSGPPPALSRREPALVHRRVGARQGGAALGLALGLAPDSVQAAGERLFTASCAGCRAGGAKVVEAVREKQAIDRHLAGGFSEKAVTHRRHALPVFAEWLSEAEFAAVAVYAIKSATDRWE